MSARAVVRLATAAIVLGACAGLAPAQGTLERQVKAAGSGTVRLTFAARPGVCGTGQQGYWSGGSARRGTGEVEVECEAGPVRVAMDMADGAPTAVRWYVGGRWGAPGNSRDLGTVGAAEASAYFLALAERGQGKVAREAIVVSTLADSSAPWPGLLRIAKDNARPRDVRTQAVFWLGQAAADAVGPLNDLAHADDEDIEVRKQAVFALSQRPKDEGVPALLAIARGKADARVRKSAIFWLGQSGDPRAVQYFEDVLSKR